MTTGLTGTLSGLYHYPVKGLSPQQLSRVDLRPGQGFPYDRVFALARADGGYDPAAFRPLPKNRFFALMTDATLAALHTRFDADTGRLTVSKDGETLIEADLAAPADRAALTRMIADHLGLENAAPPLLAQGGENRFTDISVVSKEKMHAISLINLATVEAFSDRIGKPVDPMRFRANIYFDGWPAGAELDLVGREIQIGAATARVVLRTQRCPATQVNPATAQRDLDVPDLIRAEYGHRDMGVYAEITQGGAIAPGAPIVA